jgi:hypothetical protein
VLLTTSRCSKTPMERSKVPSDSARAFSCAPESTWTDGSTFRMLWALTSRTVKLWSSWNHWADLWETSRIAETPAQLCRIHREQPRHLRSSARNLVPYDHRSGCYITTRHCSLVYLSVTVTRVATSHYGMHHLSLSMYIHMGKLAAEGTWVWLQDHLDMPIERP